MLFKITKDGSITLTQPAWAGLVCLAVLFGSWMTKISYDVSGWGAVGQKVDKIERILIHNRLEVPTDISKNENKWNDSPLPSPYSYASSALQGATSKPASASETP